MFTNVWYSHPVLLSWAYSGNNVFSQVIFDDVRNREWDSLQSESEICLKWVWKSFWISAKRCCGWAQLYNFCLKLWTDFQIILLISETFTCQIVNRYLPLIHCIQGVCTCWSHEISLNFIPTMMAYELSPNSCCCIELELVCLYWQRTQAASPTEGWADATVTLCQMFVHGPVMSCSVHCEVSMALHQVFHFVVSQLQSTCPALLVQQQNLRQTFTIHIGPASSLWT